MKLFMKHFKYYFTILLILVSTNKSFTQVLDLIVLDGNTLNTNKKLIYSGDKRFNTALTLLTRLADTLLTKSLYSVMEKQQTPPSGNKHDYYSQSPYWWPDTTKKDSLPYIYRDGVVNPAVNKITDLKNFNLMVNSVSDLALAYYFSDSSKYSVGCAALIKNWFLNPATKMNPNANYAQVVPGFGADGSGIIDLREISSVLDAAILIGNSPNWTETDNDSLISWCSEYLKWLLNDSLGKKVAARTNNDVTWYDTQVGALALFTGDIKTSTHFLIDSTKKLVNSQIDTDGSQPQELARTRAFTYSVFNLNAFFRLASIAEKGGMDLWDYQTTDGTSIKTALDWIIPYAQDTTKWKYPQITNFDVSTVFYALRVASVKFQDYSYEKLSLKLAKKLQWKDITSLTLPLVIGDSTVVRTDFFLKLRDNVMLDCSRFVPAADSTMPANGWPVMLYCHGYADSKSIEIDNAYAQAQFGYYTFCYSMRGQGKSGGKSNLISTTEMDDLKEVINYIKNDSNSNVDPTHIGIFGSSQGGIIPFMAACNGLDVRCIHSDLASPEFATSWFENGCVKMSLFWSVDYDTTLVRYNQEVKDIRRLILDKSPAKWDSLELLMPRNRDFTSKVKDCKVPMLLSNAWQDKFFNATGNIKIVDTLKSPYRMYFGAIDGHGSDTTTDENNFFTQYESNWIDYWLNDINNHITDSVKYTYAASRFPLNGPMWSFTRFDSKVWEPENINNVKLYFLPSHLLGLNPNKAAKDTLDFENNVKDSTLTMQEAINYQFKGLVFATKFEKSITAFETVPLTNDFHMVGIPKLNLYYSSDAKVCQYNCQLFEVDSSKTSHLVTRINYTDRHYVKNEVRNRLIEGLAHSHIFKKGNKIRVIFTNLDTQPGDSFLLTNPYVLPVLEKSENTIYMSAARPSYLELPVRDIGTDVIEPELPEISNNELTEVFPNPSSGHINISLNIHTPQNIKLYLSDYLGNIIYEADKGQIESGNTIFSLDLYGLATGIYYLKINYETGFEAKKIIIMQR